MNRRPLLAAALVMSLLGGCAATGDITGESELVDRIRQELALDPLLDSSRITLAETDGQVVIGGFVDSLEEIDAIREVIEGVEGVANVDNQVIVQGE